MIDARRGGDYGKIACVFMGRLKRNGQILIGKTYPLSLNTFKAVCFCIRIKIIHVFSKKTVSHISDYVIRIPFTGTYSLESESKNSCSEIKFVCVWV